jgi:hypothetical protein
MRIALPVTLLAVLLVLLAETALAAREPSDRELPYDAHFAARFLPERGYVQASIEIGQPDDRLRVLDLNAPEERYSRFRGDGTITRDGERLIWEIPSGGGRLEYRVKVERQRRNGAYDSRMTERWAVLRLDNLFPAARATGSPRAVSRSVLHLTGPEGWSFETPYGKAREPVEVKQRRRFTRPAGWMAGGDIGVRRTVIAGRDVAIAGPRGENFRRMDMLAFLHWTVPELARVVPSLPGQFVIVAGTHDMWRGGLSGPASLYIHPGRPLLSGNSTSTLLHELIHVAMAGTGDPGDDWIVEGARRVLQPGGPAAQRRHRRRALRARAQLEGTVGEPQERQARRSLLWPPHGARSDPVPRPRRGVRGRRQSPRHSGGRPVRRRCGESPAPGQAGRSGAGRTVGGARTGVAGGAPAGRRLEPVRNREGVVLVFCQVVDDAALAGMDLIALPPQGWDPKTSHW